MAKHTAWYRRKLVWALISLVVIGVVVVFAADPLIEIYMRKQFAAVEGYQVTFEHAHLRPLHVDLEVTHFKVVKVEAGGDSEPMIYLDKFDFGLRWKELIHGHMVATLDIDKAKVHLIAAKSKEKSQMEEVPAVGKRLETISPLRFDRISAQHSELTFIDRSAKEEARIWLHNFDATAENLATRAELSRGQPTVIAVSGNIQKNGEIFAYITADPLAQGLWFSGEARATGIQVNEFHDLIATHSGIALDRGVLDVFAKFESKNSHITGGVRPVLKDAHAVPAKAGVGNWFKSAVADAALKIFANHTEPGAGETERVATTIPISGDVTDPKIQLWPTIFGVVRNAFVEGLTESFAHLPPPVAEKHENIIEQAADALNKGKVAPKVQPGANKS